MIPQGSNVLFRSAVFFMVSLALSLCLCAKKRPEPQPIDASDEYVQKKLAEQKNMPDLTITATDEDLCGIVFLGGPDTATALYFIGSNGKGLKKKPCGWIGSTIQVSPDGKKFLYQGNSESAGGECQVLYDAERDTFTYYKLYSSYGAAPRWWDNDNIYYLASKVIVKQNIHQGDPVVITHKTGEYNWYDPVWTPSIQQYIQIGKKEVEFDALNGATTKIEPMPYKPDNQNHVVVFNSSDKWGIAFGIIFDSDEGIKSGYYARDLAGNTIFLKKKIGSCKDYTQTQVTVDPKGKWIYYHQRIFLDPSNPKSIHLIKRISIEDSTKDQLIYFDKNSFGMLTCYSTPKK